MKNLIFLLNLFILLSLAVFGRDVFSIKPQQNEGNSLLFIENRGQFRYNDGKKADDVLFVVNTRAGKILLKKNGISFCILQIDSTSKNEKKQDKMLSAIAIPEQEKIKAETTEMLFEGGNTDCTVSAAEPESYYNNYYIGHDEYTFVKNFRKVVYENVYPNIDFAIYSNKGEIEYDFVVRPGGNLMSFLKIKVAAFSMRLILSPIVPLR